LDLDKAGKRTDKWEISKEMALPERHNHHRKYTMVSSVERRKDESGNAALQEL
jgi:hypothetical protein